MFIVVSNNPRVPKDLDGFQVENWSAEEFLDRASSDDGIEIDEGIWYDVSYLTEPIYDGLKAYKEAGVNLIYYRFDDKPDVDFAMEDNVVVYETVQPKVETVQETPQPLVEPTPQPVVAPTVEPQVVEQPMAQQPIVEQPIYVQPQVAQPQMVQQPMVQQPITQQPMTQPIAQPMAQGEYVAPQVNQPTQPTQIANGVKLAGSGSSNNATKNIITTNMSNMLQFDDYDSITPQANRKAAPAKVILFGSSKGGTGKTFTCLISAYWYAKTHPTERIALADFDIIDGQVGITINKLTPTMQDFYKVAKAGHNDFARLDNCKVKSDHFSPNIDFYLAPSQDIPTITNDNEFWTDVFKLLITNYDVVFFDSGIDYLGKPPISQLYKIADKIIITCNPSINSVKSVIKQFKTLSGQRINNVFRPGDDILSRTNVVLTRVYDNQTINDLVVQNIVKFAPVIAAFGNIDDIISQVQWYQQWELIDQNSEITDSLEDITRI